MGKKKRLNAGTTREQRMAKRRAADELAQWEAAARAQRHKQALCPHENQVEIEGDTVCTDCDMNLSKRQRGREAARSTVVMAGMIGSPIGRL